jgi:DNA polymerase-4
MASSMAYKLCPHAVFIKPRGDAYVEASKIIREVFYDYTDLVEPLSLDEAFLDVTKNFKNNPSATLIAQEIRAKIYRETKLSSSAGVSYNKFLAKVASDVNKPNGLFVITPGEALEFLEKLPVRRFFGIGRVTEEKMFSLGVKTGADLLKLSKPELLKLFGKAGEYYYSIVRGIDNRPVEPSRLRKSIGKEETFAEDIIDVENLLEILKTICERVGRSLEKHGEKGRCVTLKIKYFNFKSVTRSYTSTKSVCLSEELYRISGKLLDLTDAGKVKVRLLGVSVSNFDSQRQPDFKDLQMELPFGNTFYKRIV